MAETYGFSWRYEPDKTVLYNRKGTRIGHLARSSFSECWYFHATARPRFGETFDPELTREQAMDAVELYLLERAIERASGE